MTYLSWKFQLETMISYHAHYILQLVITSGKNEVIHHIHNSFQLIFLIITKI